MNGFTQVDNDFIDTALSELSANAVKCMLIIYRETIGWQNKSVELSTEELLKKTGISNKKTVYKSINELEIFGALGVKKSNGKRSIFTIKAVPKNGSGTKKHHNQKMVPLPVPKNGIGPSIYKEREIKEREGESFSEDVKKNFIAYLIQDEDIKNPKGFEKSIRTKINQKDQATIEMLINWKEEDERKKQFMIFKKAVKGKTIAVHIHQEEFKGSISSIDIRDEDYVVSIIDNKGIYKSIRFGSLDRIKENIQELQHISEAS